MAVVEMLMSVDRITTGDVVRALRVSRSAAYRCLGALERHQVVVLSATGRGYLPGPRMLMCGMPRLPAPRLIRLEKVRRATEARTSGTVRVSVLRGADVITLGSLGPAAGSHTVACAYAGSAAASQAAGRLLIAAFDEVQVDALFRYIDQAARIPICGTFRGLPVGERSAIRDRGWAFGTGFGEPASLSVAIPLDGASWRLRSALVATVQRTRDIDVGAVAQAMLTVVGQQRADGVVDPWSFSTGRRRTRSKAL